MNNKGGNDYERKFEQKSMVYRKMCCRMCMALEVIKNKFYIIAR